MKGLLNYMLTCPFSSKQSRAVSGFLFGGAGWWRVVNKTNGFGPADDFFQFSLYPTYSVCSIYIMCPTSKPLQPIRSHEGQKLARVWMDTHVSSAGVQLPLCLCPLSLLEMADLAWQDSAFSRKAENPEFCVRPPNRITLAINFLNIQLLLGVT